ncbi:MAG: hypothetical protein QF792_08775, partial [Phycisphaerae bacterium]|nr:hypothetical protein [Phycisphaerae bacterium]
MEQKATKQFLCILATCGVLIGCQGPSGHKPDVAKLAPLPIQQARAYGETVTGLFVSLVDFEDTPDGPSGFDQVEYFTIGPAGRTGTRKFVVNVTRTGTGAMAVTLGPESQLIFTSPDVRNLAGYTLLTMALHSEAHSPARVGKYHVLIRRRRIGLHSTTATRPTLRRPIRRRSSRPGESSSPGPA